MTLRRTTLIRSAVVASLALAALAGPAGVTRHTGEIGGLAKSAVLAAYVPPDGGGGGGSNSPSPSGTPTPTHTSGVALV